MDARVLDYLKENYIAIAATVAAILSALYAFRSNVISKKALKLGYSEYFNKQANFTVYVINAFRYRIISDNQSRKLLLFNVTLNNRSETKNSFKAILEIEFLRKDNSVSRIRIEHDPTLEKDVAKADVTTFRSDIKMDEKSIETGWLIFEEPASIFNDFRIEKFRIGITDVNGNAETSEILIIRDIDNENRNNKLSNL